jgi:hypothetical protein
MADVAHGILPTAALPALLFLEAFGLVFVRRVIAQATPAEKPTLGLRSRTNAANDPLLRRPISTSARNLDDLIAFSRLRLPFDAARASILHPPLTPPR